MTTAAILLVKDEADIIGFTLAHLEKHVDAIYAWDNGSTDGTREILQAAGILFGDDAEVGYYQADKMSRFAEEARRQGHDWALPVDADEMWVCEPNGRPIREHLLSLAPDVMVCEARLFHYLPTAADPAESEAPSPFARIGWRLAEPSSLPKVAARLREGLRIDPGNHGCSFSGSRASLSAGGLRVNHYSWRSAEQYGRKIRNGARAYAATDLPEEVGPHWRMWGDPDAPDLEERAAAHFRRYFWAPEPPFAPGSADPASLVWDPAEEA